MELKETSAIILYQKTKGGTNLRVLCVQNNPRLDILLIKTAFVHELYG